MSKSKFSNITKKASMLSNVQVEEEPSENIKFKPFYIKNVPEDWFEAVKKTGQSFSSFVKAAVYERLKREGYI